MKDPSAKFEVSAELPSGNRFFGTVGPIVNGRVAAQIAFAISPPSDEDMRVAKEAMNFAMGSPPAMTLVSGSEKEHIAAQEAVRKFFGGAKG